VRATPTVQAQPQRWEQASAPRKPTSPPLWRRAAGAGRGPARRRSGGSAGTGMSRLAPRHALRARRQPRLPALRRCTPVWSCKATRRKSCTGKTTRWLRSAERLLAEEFTQSKALNISPVAPAQPHGAPAVGPRAARHWPTRRVGPHQAAGRAAGPAALGCAWQAASFCLTEFEVTSCYIAPLGLPRR